MQVIDLGGKPVMAWVDGVEFEDSAREQVAAVSMLPFIHDHIAIMPDVHYGIGATVGSVIATIGAIVPAAVGVDIGCGMVAQRTSLRAEDLPDSLRSIRHALERSIPTGFYAHKIVPASVETAWAGQLSERFGWFREVYPKIDNGKALKQLGTLGGGNHYCELVIDEEFRVRVMLHSGSRGIGNKIGTFFIERAKRELEKRGIGLPDNNLAWFDEGTASFDDYVRAVGWAQDYARTNRNLMMARALDALRSPALGLPAFTIEKQAVNCHHNYVAKETHFAADVYVTRKGAVSARQGELGLIPGSMGARSFVVRGKGNADSFQSCSHGAGRRMGRNEAKRCFTVEDLERQTAGVECRKDAGVLDEIPGAYKDVDAVMAAQSDLVDVEHSLRAVLCIKG